MNINIEYRHESGFQNFFSKIAQKKVALMYDINTKPYALAMKTDLQKFGVHIVDIFFSDEELVPTEDKCAFAYELAKSTDYLLAVGSGTLNDMSKSVSTCLGIDCGVLITAASMDGYCSKGAALMRQGVKVTDEVHTPTDILIDLDIVCHAPRIMTAAGFGDILGKFTCLLDWQTAHIVKGEEIHQEAYALMERARAECVNVFDELVKYESNAVAKLTSALITAGLSMAMCGNSRPASGSEHHQSHFLEMDFVRRGEKIPMHGLKVAIGTLVSMELYHYLRDNRIAFAGSDAVYKLVDELPTMETLREMLVKMGCPVRFSELGVRKETMEEMIEKAYTVRDRYTVLTLVHDLGLTEQVKPLIMEKYF